MDIYNHLCLTDVSVKADLTNTGPRSFKLHCLKPWGYVPSDPDTSVLHDTGARWPHQRHSHWYACPCHFRQADIMHMAFTSTISSRDVHCGSLIGSGAPGPDIKAGTQGGIAILSHRCCLHWSVGIATAVCRFSTQTTIFTTTSSRLRHYNLERYRLVTFHWKK